MGVKEFTLSRDKHNMKFDSGSENIDTDLLYAFCNDIAQMHDAKFGAQNAHC